jgi:hypothetical protein
VYYFIIGTFLIVVGLVMGRLHPRKWRMFSNFLYVSGMSLIILAIFGLGDPIEWIPSEIWSIIQYGIVVLSFYGFLYKIEKDMRVEFDDKIKTVREDFGKHIDNLRDDIRNLRSDIQRDIDRIEKTLEKKKA